MKAIIRLEVPEYQIGEEVSCYFRDTMLAKGICEKVEQKWIQVEVLDKIRAEIETKYGQCDICEYFEDYDYEENDISEYRPIGNVTDILQIIEKYKAESEDKE